MSGLKSAVEKVQDWIAELDKQGIPADRIILGGFSQGAAVAAWAAATSSHKLAGCVLWSGYAPRHEALVSALKSGPNASGCPFIVTHGDKRSEGAANRGRAARRYDQESGCRAEIAYRL